MRACRLGRGRCPVLAWRRLRARAGLRARRRCGPVPALLLRSGQLPRSHALLRAVVARRYTDARRSRLRSVGRLRSGRAIPMPGRSDVQLSGWPGLHGGGRRSDHDVRRARRGARGVELPVRLGPRLLPGHQSLREALPDRRSRMPNGDVSGLGRAPAGLGRLRRQPAALERVTEPGHEVRFSADRCLVVGKRACALTRRPSKLGRKDAASRT
jgi:hypothetical protein